MDVWVVVGGLSAISYKRSSCEDKEAMRELVLKVEGMSCGHCVKAVEEALKAVPGVVQATVSLADSKAVVKTDDSVGLACVQAIEEEGYRAEVLKESTIPL